jgi:hypothetical protein
MEPARWRSIRIVEIAALHGIEGVEGEVVEDQEVDCQQFPDLGFVAVVEPRVLDGLQYVIGAERKHAVPASARDMPRVRARGRSCRPRECCRANMT